MGQTTVDTQEPKFCAQCGKSLVPLTGIHVQRTCADCGKHIFVREPGQGGQGIKISRGDKIHFPAGSIEISLRPSSHSHLFRPGVSWFIQQILFYSAPKKPNDIGSLLDAYEKLAEEALRSSDKTKGLNLDDEGDSEKLFAKLAEDKDSVEWWAYLVGGYSSVARDAAGSGDLERYGFALFHATASHAMLTYKREMEDLVWRGYLANKVVYDAASAAAKTPADAEAIASLRPLFEKLDQDILYSWVKGGEPIAPKIGFSGLPEGSLRALAEFHLASKQKEAEDAERIMERKKSDRDMKLRWLGIGAAVVSAVVGALKALSVI